MATRATASSSVPIAQSVLDVRHIWRNHGSRSQSPSQSPGQPSRPSAIGLANW